MTRRSKLSIAIALILLATVASFVAVKRFAWNNAAAGAPGISGHFTLTTPDGRIATDRSYRGKFLLVYFGYTFCPDACPTALTAISLALDQLGPLADKFQPIFITVDPERDTPQIVADYVKAFDPRIIGLVGSSEQIAAAAKAYRVYYLARKIGEDEYVVDHSSFIYVVNPQGEFVKLLTGDLPGHRIADELQRLVK